jgi:sialate O-acetylesterase
MLMRTISVFSFFLAIVVAAAAFGADAALRLSTPFGDHMLLQRDLPDNIWGVAAPGAAVDVDINNVTAKATADAQGNWSLKLPPLAAGGPYVMHVRSGSDSIDVNDVLVGELWLCSGQSNMAWTLRNFADREDKTINDDIAAADNPLIRVATVAPKMAFEPMDDTPVRWDRCTPEAAPEFSATAYFFAKNLQKALGVPVGIVNSSWSGTPAEAWTDRGTLQSDPAFQSALDRFDAYPKNYPQMLAKWKEQVAAINAQPAGATTKPKRPAKPLAPDANSRLASVLWNGKIHPLAPMTFRGIVWYQGEADAEGHRSTMYAKLLPAMFGAWRKAFGQPDAMNVLIVQLPLYGEDRTGVHGSRWAQLRESQAKAVAAMGHAALCVTLDIGAPKLLHPPTKREVGRRLSLLAEKTVYGHDVAATGPAFTQATFDGGKATLQFDLAADVTLKNDPQATDFLLAGKDQQWHVATATLVNGAVVLQADGVAQPVAARYAWSDAPHAVLAGKDGLPVAPFRTDDWPLLPDRQTHATAE